MVQKKLSDSLPLQIQHLSHPHSVFVSVSPTHCLFLTSHPLPTPLHLFPYFLSDFSLYCLVFFPSIAPFSLIPVLSVLWHPPRRSQRGLAASVATSLFVDVGPGQLSSASCGWIGARRKVQGSLKKSPVTAVISLDAYIHVCLMCWGREDCWQSGSWPPTFQYFPAMSPATFYWD